jgi:nonphosphorylating glyceraldehyde-3-phosphate dehydrogenase (EC 1.2.1.9)
MAKLRELSGELRDIYTVNSDEVLSFKTYIAGIWTSTKDLEEVKSPIDLEVYAKVPKLNYEMVDMALQTLYRKGRWEIRDMPGEKRLKVFHTLASLLEKFRQDFVDVLVIGNGKTLQLQTAKLVQLSRG